MSRIYQGGQSQNSYQARDRKEGYNPTQALSNKQSIVQEGESQLRDLKTQDREQQRRDIKAKAETSARDTANMSTLQMEQMQAQNLLKQQQIVENAELQTAELAAQSKLSMSNLTEKNTVVVDQLTDKNIHQINQFREASTFKLAQMVESNTLALDLQLDANLLSSSQQLEKGNLALNQRAAGDSLALNQMGAKGALSLEQLGAKGNLSLGQKAAQGNLTMSQNSERGQQAISQQGARNSLKLGQMADNNSLQAERAFGDYSLKQEQSIDNYILRQSQIRDNNILKNSQQVSQYGLKGRQALSSNQLRQSQSLAQGALRLDQLVDSNALKLSQNSESMGLRYVQGADQTALKLSQQQDSVALNAEQAAQKADMNLASQHLSLSQQTARANTAQISNAISSLISFGGTVAKHVAAQQAVAEKEQAGRDEFNDLLHTPLISSSGVVNPVVSNEADLRKVEIAEELAIQQMAPGDTVTQEAIRQPGADQSMMRAESQSYVAGSALNLPARLNDLVASNPSVMNGQGQYVPLNSLRTEASYAAGVKQLVRGLYEADGISQGDSYAAYTTWGKAARGAYNESVQNGWPKVAQRIKGERYDAGLGVGTNLAMNGQAQSGWNASVTNAVSSGHFDSKTLRELNTQTLKDHISRLPQSKIKDLLNVRKIGDQAGTEFGNSPEYRKIIMDAYNGRTADENKYFTTQQTAATQEVKQITQGVNMDLMADGLDGEQSKQIRQQAIERLEFINSPQSMEAAQLLREKGGNNQSVYLGLVEDYESGNPPSSEILAAARADDSISHEQLTSLKAMGLRSDQITQAMERAGLPTADKQLKNMISMRLAALRVESTERGVLADILSAQLLPEVKARFNNFLNQVPPPSSLQVQQEANKIMQDVGQQLHDPRDPDGGMVSFDHETGFASVNVEAYGRTTTRKNPTTGEFQKNYIQVKPENIPSSGLSINDAYLNKDTFLKGVELWDKGRPAAEYPKRIRDVAAKLGVSPTSFIRSQAQALGYPSIEKVSPALTTNPPTDMKTGFNALQSMGFPTRGAAYLAGNIMQESSWNGSRSWGEVANDGSDRNGGLVSWMDGVAHNNFRLTKIEDYLGKNISQASPSEQLQAMQWEMKRDYSNSYRIFMNPNATDVQLRRASKAYWGYHRDYEGERFSNAESLLR